MQGQTIGLGMIVPKAFITRHAETVAQLDNGCTE